MRRKKLIAANWKMNKTRREAEEFAADLKKKLCQSANYDLLVFPPFPSISVVAESLQGTNVHIGAQDIFWEASGAFTGEVSGEMIKDSGGEYVLVGHSERRSVIGESDIVVAQKLKAAFLQGLTPVLCVGESLEEREEGRMEEVVTRQLSSALQDVDPRKAEKLVVAYEPVWAIGTGRSATAEDAERMHVFIRGFLRDKYGKSVSEHIRIQYGGSVKPENAASLLEKEEIDGALIGGASLNVDSFLSIAFACPPGS